MNENNYIIPKLANEPKERIRDVMNLPGRVCFINFHAQCEFCREYNLPARCISETISG